MKKLALVLALVITGCFATTPITRGAIQVTFEELDTFSGNNLAGGGSFFNGNAGAGSTNELGWSSQGVFFSNSYNGDSLPLFDFWSGFAYSNVVNPNTSGFENQYAAFPGGGANGSGGVAAGGNYAIAFGGGAYIDIPVAYQLQSLEVTNTTYAGLAMRDGDSFSKRFGGAGGNDPDLFQVTFTGFDGQAGAGNVVGAVTVDLADYRFADNSLDYVLSNWLTVDMSSLGGARSLSLSFFSTDIGPFGINTPTYVAIDNLTFTVVPEPSAMVGLLGLIVVLAARRRASLLDQR